MILLKGCDYLSKRKTSIICLFVCLFEFILILYDMTGSIQLRLSYFQDFSLTTVKFIFKTLAMFVAGGLFFYFSRKFSIFSLEQNSERKNSQLFLIAGYVLYLMAIVLGVLKKWAVDNFPMYNSEIVFFTIKNLSELNFDKSILFEVRNMLSACFITVFLCFAVIFLCSRKAALVFYFSKLQKTISFNLVHFIFSFFALLLIVVNICVEFDGSEYLKLAVKFCLPVRDSEFYIEEYTAPEYENIIFPENKKNLILIFAESLESSFADKENGGLMDKNLIPNLTKLAGQNTSFSNSEKLGGGIDLYGTGWTVAGMLSKLSGLPFNLPGERNGDYENILPNAITLTDILSHNGYRQLFLFGSEKHFASRDVLLEKHGGVEIHDIDWYKKNGFLPEDYSVFWGFEDKKLFSFARQELNEIGKNQQPFMFGMLTVDTHFPSGYQCELCPDTEDMPIKNSVLCADKQISGFVEWCKNQSWYKDTVIVIMGDHLYMAPVDMNPFGSSEYLNFSNAKDSAFGKTGNPRRWLNLFINCDKEAESSSRNNRIFSSFDMFPTILSALGCEIKDEKLGFGVNLFSGKKTLPERFSVNHINSELMVYNRQYEKLCK